LPRDLAQKHEAKPPLATTLAEGRVFVRHAGSAKLVELGLEPGVEIVAVEGRSPREHAEASFGRRICASTPQDRDVRLLSYQLLRGDADQPVRLTIIGRDGKERQVDVARGGYTDAKTEARYSFDVLAGNIAHVALRSCEGDDLVKQFEADLPRLLACDALVLDIRDNGGGNSNVGYGFLAALTDQPFSTSRWATPLYRPAYRAWGRPTEWHTGKSETRQPRAGDRFLKPVALLIGPRTFSAAEDLAVAFDAMKRGPLVGEATGGSTGQPLSFPLPGGGSARVCSKRDTYPDGKAFVGVGVQPTQAVTPKAEDLRVGRDTVLEAALQLLRDEVKRAPK
jgi:C-terminal processing protease CtpA/Prc